jgi:hypothetical protein
MTWIPLYGSDDYQLALVNDLAALAVYEKVTGHDARLLPGDRGGQRSNGWRIRADGAFPTVNRARDGREVLIRNPDV